MEVGGARFFSGEVRRGRTRRRARGGVTTTLEGDDEEAVRGVRGRGEGGWSWEANAVVCRARVDVCFWNGESWLVKKVGTR